MQISPHKLLVCILIYLSCVSGAFETSVITLSFPSGARLNGMGEVGTALADDENVLFYNPAGLGVYNYRWHGGAISEFFEPLLPILELDDLYHNHLSACYQIGKDIGGFSVNINHISFGLNTVTDGAGRNSRSFYSSETVKGISWGFDLQEFKIYNHYLGLSLKFVSSLLAPGYDPSNPSAGTGYTIAFDLGYLWQFTNQLRFGATLMNMGPPIYYVTKTEKNPIPFNINLALAYKDTFQIGNLNIFHAAAEFRISREFAKAYAEEGKDPDPFWKALYTDWADTTFGANMMESNFTLGGEFVILNTFAFRNGFLFDYIGERYELHAGTGFHIFNHFNIDYYYIISPEGFFKNIMRNFVSKEDSHYLGSHGIRHNQWGISVAVTRLLYWPDSDKKWWQVPTER